MTLTNRDVAQDIGLINCDIGCDIACIFYFATADGQESGNAHIEHNKIMFIASNIYPHSPGYCVYFE